MMDLYAMRRNEPPVLSGAEAMETVLASQLMDKAEYHAILSRIISELASHKNSIPAGVRLMILGSENNDIDLLKAIETWGANIVIDDHCVGSRYFWGEIIQEDDRIRALANRYVQRPPCPTKDFPERRRLPYVVNLAREYKVQAAVIILQKFCEPHQFDTPLIESALKKINVPTVVLEIDAPVSLGQVRIRVESLLDMIRIEA